MKKILLVIFLIAIPCYAEIVAPEGYVLQNLDLTNGTALRPDGWFYSQQHRSKNYLRWVISKENADANNGGYETGVSINLIHGFTEKSGMSSEQLAKTLISQISGFGEIIKSCEPQKVGDMVRVCIEKLEKNDTGESHRVMYTFMWWPSAELVAYTSAGTKPELWEQYTSKFDVMAEVEVVGNLGARNTHNNARQ